MPVIGDPWYLWTIVNSPLSLPNIQVFRNSWVSLNKQLVAISSTNNPNLNITRIICGFDSMNNLYYSDTNITSSNIIWKKSPIILPDGIGIKMPINTSCIADFDCTVYTNNIVVLSTNKICCLDSKGKIFIIDQYNGTTLQYLPNQKIPGVSLSVNSFGNLYYVGKDAHIFTFANNNFISVTHTKPELICAKYTWVNNDGSVFIIPSKCESSPFTWNKINYNFEEAPGKLITKQFMAPSGTVEYVSPDRTIYIKYNIPGPMNYGYATIRSVSAR